MNKTIKFQLNQFPVIPHLLRTDPSINAPGSEFSIDLSRLYHHYYTDSYEVAPPSPDHTNFEYLKFLDSCSDFRFLLTGVGASEAHKRTVSYKMGQAFCRYFLYEFCGITYFAHMDKVIDRPLHPAFNGMQIKRVQQGDIPDYLCAKSVGNPFIGEAKGRFSSINFSTSQFNDWRDQFTRIRVCDRFGQDKRVKGYIVATKFSTDQNRTSNKSKILAEDPETVGDQNISNEDTGLSQGCKALHYSKLVSKLGLNLLASSLDEGFTVPTDLHYSLPVWECLYPPLAGKKFVGGFYSEIEPSFQEINGEAFFKPNILKLGLPTPSFYGLQLDTFRTLRKVCHGEWNLLSEIAELQDTESRGSNIAWLRDGSITGALDFFKFIGFQTF